MSHFKSAMKLLGPLKKPLFIKMRKERRAYPMAIGIYEVLIAERPDRALPTQWGMTALTRSKRYQKSMLEENAMRYNAEGIAVAPISDDEREHARRRLKNIINKAAVLWPKVEEARP